MIRRARLGWAAATAVTLAAILVLDYATGDVSVSIFYLLPIFVATWRGKTGAGIIAAAASSIAMFVMEDVVERPAGRPIVYWDDVMKIAFLLVVAVLSTRLREALQRERELRAGLELRVQERTAQLELGANELRAFNYAVAHHLRSPLRGIARLARRHEGIQAAVGRLDAIIEGLLDISSVPVADVRREEVNLSSMAGGVLDELRKASPDRRVRPVIEERLTARGDPRLLQLALRALLGNAWKFTSGRGEGFIEFGARRQAEELVYFVGDNGAGFDMAYAARLFHPFERLHSPDQYAGVGIGLTLARQAVSRHGGRIWAESRPGAGATFFFTLEPGPRATVGSRATSAT